MKFLYRHKIPVFPVVALLLFLGTRLRAQETDSLPADTVAVQAADSTLLPPDEEEPDTAVFAKYNYYISRDQWPEQDSLRSGTIPDSVVAALRRDDAFWYANASVLKQQPAAAKQSFWEWLSLQQWYRVLAWGIIIGGFIAVVIWYLASSDVRIFRRRNKIIHDNSGGENPENIFSMEYPAGIAKAELAADYRLATRLLFLQLLKDLATNNLIQYQQERTNSFYLGQLRNTGYYNDFFRLVRNYEYAWYGQFAVSRQIYDRIKNDFTEFTVKMNTGL
ncbi:MAG TPA: hypothetical protein VFS36_03600 [Chitinophagaceae bacterium]|nr:hypothetical protein [Chitinophagaceae bacterium]